MEKIGTIIKQFWDNATQSHYLIIEDQEKNIWSFGGCTLSSEDLVQAWNRHLYRLFRHSSKDDLIGKSVHMYFENDELVAIYVYNGGMHILDLRNIFEEVRINEKD